MTLKIICPILTLLWIPDSSLQAANLTDIQSTWISNVYLKSIAKHNLVFSPSTHICSFFSFLHLKNATIIALLLKSETKSIPWFLSLTHPCPASESCTGTPSNHSICQVQPVLSLYYYNPSHVAIIPHLNKYHSFPPAFCAPSAPTVYSPLSNQSGIDTSKRAWSVPPCKTSQRFPSALRVKSCSLSWMPTTQTVFCTIVYLAHYGSNTTVLPHFLKYSRLGFTIRALHEMAPPPVIPYPRKDIAASSCLSGLHLNVISSESPFLSIQPEVAPGSLITLSFSFLP